MKRTRSHYSSPRSRSPSPEPHTDVALSRTLRVPVTPTKAGLKEFGSPLAREKSVGARSTTAAAVAGAAAGGTASSSMLPPPSPHKTGQQHREKPRRAPLSRLQESAGGSRGAHDSALVAPAATVPTFQSPSKQRVGFPYAPPNAAAAAQAALCSPPRVMISGGAMRVLTPGKASRSRSSMGGVKTRNSSGDALVGGADADGAGTSSSDSSSGAGSGCNRSKENVSSSAPRVPPPPPEGGDVAAFGAGCAGGEGGKAGGGGPSVSHHRYGAARRVSSRGRGSGGDGRSRGEGEQEDSTDDADGYGRRGPRLAVGYSRVNARKTSSGSNGSSGSSGSSGSGRVRISCGGGSGGDGSAAADCRASEPSRRVSTTLRSISSSRAGVNTVTDTSRGSTGGGRGSSERAGTSSWGPLVLAHDDGPRRVSTWSNSSGGGTGGHADVKDAPRAGRRSVSRSNGGTGTFIRKRKSSTGEDTAGAGAGGNERSGLAGRRASAAKRVVGAACDGCGGGKAGGEGGRGEASPCEDCTATETERQRPAAKRVREGSGGVAAAIKAQPSRRRSAAPPTLAETAAGDGSGGSASEAFSTAAGARLGGQDPGRRMSIDDFQVGSKLGKGKFGIVYKAKCKLSKRTVAIKMIYKSYLRDGTPQDRVNLDRERRLQAQVRHPNIVGVQNCFQAPKFVYLVLDYAAGGDMFKMLSQHKNGLPVETAAAYLRDAAAAVDHLHSVHIMHRDIKAENLLLDSKGRLKLSDFGWAVLAKPPLDRRQTMCGTPEYAAPEIVAFHRQYTKAVDIWSLGVLAFELLTGQTPFANPMIPGRNHPIAVAAGGGDGTASGTAGSHSYLLGEPHNASDPTPNAGTGAPAAAAAAAAAEAEAATSSAAAATAAEIEAVHRGDVHARLYGRIAGWSGSRESLFGPGARGAEIPEPARDAVMGMLRPRPEDRLESGEVLRLPWVASRGQGAGAGAGVGVAAAGLYK